MPYKCPAKVREYQQAWRKKHAGYHSRYWHKVVKPLSYPKRRAVGAFSTGR